MGSNFYWMAPEVRPRKNDLVFSFLSWTVLRCFLHGLVRFGLVLIALVPPMMQALGIDSESNTVTGKSDVYSYGMLLWEMLTGQQPYASYSPVQAALGVAVHGMRPTIPDTTFLPLKCLIEQCWASDPLDRPDFSEVLEVLDMATQELLSRDKS